MPKEHIPYLDGWRGLAIGMVLMQHFSGERVINLGLFGVSLFFVLSGLLMSRILFEQRTPIRIFYRHRVSRILPVFLLFVAVCWIGWGRGAHGWELVSTLTFTRTYFIHPMIWYSRVPDGNLWSLNVEEHCYMLLAAIAAFSALRIKAAPILFSLAGMTLLALAIHLHFYRRDHSFPYMLTTECSSGALLLSAAYRRVYSKFTVPAWAPALALMLGAFCYLEHLPWREYLLARYVASPVLLAFSVNHIQESWRWITRSLEWAPLRQLGILSYSIYLWQQIFMKHGDGFPYHTAVLGAIGAGVVSYYMFERPARGWLNTHWGVKNQETLQTALLPRTSPLRSRSQG